MKMQKIDSSSLSLVGYDPSRRILEAHFHNGGVYRYYNLSVSVFRALLSAPSKGAYFNHRIRDRYVCRKIK